MMIILIYLFLCSKENEAMRPQPAQAATQQSDQAQYNGKFCIHTTGRKRSITLHFTPENKEISVYSSFNHLFIQSTLFKQKSCEGVLSVTQFIMIFLIILFLCSK